MSIFDLINPEKNVDKANNLLVPASKVKLSAILSRNGWGAPGSQMNRQARAIVKRESTGDPGATNQNTNGTQDTGLFQINDVNMKFLAAVGAPQDLGAFHTWLKNPDNNAKAARALYDNGGWQPWKSSGGMPAPTVWDPQITTDKGTVTGAVSDAAGAVTEPIAILGNVAGALLNPSTWSRLGKGALGGIMIIIGVGGLVYVVGNKVNPEKAAVTLAKTLK